MSETELDPPITIRRLRSTVLFALYSLIALFFISSLQVTTRPGITTVVIWLIQVAPLLIFIPALHRNHLRAYAWLSFIVLIYFIHGVMTAFNSERFLLGLIDSLLCSLLFIALVFFIRKYRDYYKVPV